MAKEERVQLRMSTEDKELIRKAAELDHRSLTMFVTVSALEKAKKMIEAADKKEGQ